MNPNAAFFSIKTKRLLDLFDNFRDEFDSFHKDYAKDNDFVDYVDAKVRDLRKDVDWLRKIHPTKENTETK